MATLHPPPCSSSSSSMAGLGPYMASVSGGVSYICWLFWGFPGEGQGMEDWYGVGGEGVAAEDWGRRVSCRSRLARTLGTVPSLAQEGWGCGGGWH